MMGKMDLYGNNLKVGGMATDTDILQDLISADQASELKAFMVKADLYYGTKNDIRTRDFRTYFVNGIQQIDHNKSNEHMINNLFKKLIDQKSGYVAGKPIVFSLKDKDDNPENQAYLERVNDLLGEDFSDLIHKYVKSASKKGLSWIHPYIDAQAQFKLRVIDPIECIEVLDTEYQETTTQLIRYYVLEEVQDGKRTEVIRADVWDSQKVTSYIQQEDAEGNKYYEMIPAGTYGLTTNPRYHWYEYNTNDINPAYITNYDLNSLPGLVMPHSWGRVPYVKCENNDECSSDLELVKNYIDAIDLVSSGFINDLRDVQLAIWVLRGYEGEDLGEFLHNLMTFKAIKLSPDADSSAEPKTMDIPKEARVAMLDWLNKKVYEVGMGVNVDDLKGGQLTNVLIKAAFFDLDLKANAIIKKLKKALRELLYFVTMYINLMDKTAYDYHVLQIKVNKSGLINETEVIDNIMKSRDFVSETTLLGYHPMVEDVENEKEQLRTEKEEMAKSMESMFPTATEPPQPKPGSDIAGEETEEEEV